MFGPSVKKKRTFRYGFHTFGAGLRLCNIGKGGLLRFSVFLVEAEDFMVLAKEALNGPLLEILFHAYIVNALQFLLLSLVFLFDNHDYLDK